MKVVPFIDRSDLLHFTTHTVLHNLTEGIILVIIVLLLLLGNVRGAIIVALTIPFSLLFAAMCLNLKHIPANLLSLGALDFGMVVDGAVVMVENIVRHLNRQGDGTRIPQEKIREAAHEVQRPVFYAIAIIITAYLPIFTLAASRRTPVQAHGMDRCFCFAGSAAFFPCSSPRFSPAFLFRKGATEWKNPAMQFLTARYRQRGHVGHPASGCDCRRRRCVGLYRGLFLAFSGVIGSEFLPHLDEGALWVRGTLAQSTGPSEGIRVANQASILLCSFPEVTALYESNRPSR